MRRGLGGEGQNTRRGEQGGARGPRGASSVRELCAAMAAGLAREWGRFVAVGPDQGASQPGGYALSAVRANGLRAGLAAYKGQTRGLQDEESRFTESEVVLAQPEAACALAGHGHLQRVQR